MKKMLAAKIDNLLEDLKQEDQDQLRIYRQWEEIHGLQRLVCKPCWLGISFEKRHCTSCIVDNGTIKLQGETK